MPHLEVTIDCLTGRLLLRYQDDLLESVRTSFARLLGQAHEVACAAPATITPPPAAPGQAVRAPSVRLAGYWHNSLIEGPGRRSVAKFQGCPIRCTGCITPDSWDLASGSLVPVDRLAEALLDPGYERDGISILGGEPFFQSAGLLALVDALQKRGCPNIVVYSGYTYERLRLMARSDSSIEAVLNRIDVLIDGPYIAALSASAGPWTGSGNQRVIDLAPTLRRDRSTLAARQGRYRQDHPDDE